MKPAFLHTVIRRSATWLGAVLIGCSAAADAQAVRADHVEAELVSAAEAWMPGKTTRVALRLKHDAGWHTYWQVPGDSGLPTKVTWSSASGLTVADLRWPAPQRLPAGPLTSFGYEGEVLLLADVRVPADAPAGQVLELAGQAEWLVCHDQCIPGSARLTLRMPTAAPGAPVRPSRWEPLFDAMEAAVPTRFDGHATAARDGHRLQLAVDTARPARSLVFFPSEEGRLEPSAAQTLERRDGRLTLALQAAQPVAADFGTLRGVLVADGGPLAGGWAQVVEVPLAVAGTAGSSGARAPTAANVAAATPTPEIPADPALQDMTVWLALLGAFLGGLVLNLMPCVFPVLSLKLLGLVQHNRGGAQPHAGPSLPAHGAAFAGGAIASFVALAGLLIALQAGGAQLGWGFQLQTPVVVGALIALFFAIGLNLLGAYEITLLTGVANSSAAQKIDTGDGLKGSFGTGVLAVVVASPCTAPFMGAALGFAVTQPWPVALSVFGMLGVGMSTPYLLLTLFPPLLRRLPRPGAWMERFKQIMAFPMFATCVWLLWVLAQQVDANALAVFLFGLVALGMAAWSLGLAQRGSRRYRWVALAAFAGTAWTVATLAGAGGAEPGSAAAPAGATATARGPGAAAATAAAGARADWARWTPESVQGELAAGRPVFVDFTAAWCVTCQANKRLVLHRAGVAEAFAQRGVVRLRADWTNRDARITQELARHGRNGVPLYVLYDRQGRATVLPEILSEDEVMTALSRLN